jgi:hypothetical protein
MRLSHLETAFKNLADSGYDKYPISPKTPLFKGYNCIAWAAGDDEKRWWPHKQNPFLFFWPPHLEREPENQETLENFIQAFEWRGYKRGCKNGKLKKGVEKVAIYTLGGIPKHAARQLESGCWTSKCGNWEDVQHETLMGVEGEIYGNAVYFLHRRRDGKPFWKDRIISFLKKIFKQQ